MRPLAAVTATTITLLSLACGDGKADPISSPDASNASTQGPSVRIVLEFDTSSSSLPSELDVESEIEFAEKVMKARILNLGGFNIDTLQEGSNRLSIEFQGIALDEATDLLGSRALLEFRQPVLDDSGRVVCSLSDGSQFTAEPEQITETVSESGGTSAQCTGAQGETGEVKWEPAAASTNGQAATLDIFSVREASYEEQDRYGPLVVLDFTSDGSLLFERVTERLVGYPLGIFVDDQLIVAPTVQQPISVGKAVITSLNVDEARVLAAQLNAGPMPVPVRVISAEDIPE